MASSPPQLPHPCARTARELSVSLSALCQSAWGCQPRGAPQPEGITKPWRQIHSELWWTCDHDDTTCPPPTQPLWQPCSWSTLFCTPLSLLPLCTGLRPPGSPGRQAWSPWSLARLTTQDMGSPRVVAAPHPTPPCGQAGTLRESRGPASSPATYAHPSFQCQNAPRSSSQYPSLCFNP